MSIDYKLLLSVVVLAAGGLTSFVILQQTVQAQTTTIVAVASDTEELEGVVDDLDDTVKSNTEAIQDQARGLNWIGAAVQAIAEKQDVRLPPRPIVAED